MKLKLNNLSKNILNIRKMKEPKGGVTAVRSCSCFCVYEGKPEVSSTNDKRYGGYSLTGDNAYKTSITVG